MTCVSGSYISLRVGPGPSCSNGEGNRTAQRSELYGPAPRTVLQDWIFSPQLKVARGKDKEAIFQQVLLWGTVGFSRERVGLGFRRLELDS